MTRDVERALASHFDRYAVRRELHHELPHTVYEVTVDGRRAVCKVARGETADVGAEAAVVDYVDRATDLPAPTILAADRTAFVAEWADALPREAETPHPDDLPDADARALGVAMARLHAATADRFTRPGFPRFAPDDGDAGVSDGAGNAAGERTAGGCYLAVDARADWNAVVRELLAAHRDYLAPFGWAAPVERALALLDDRPGLFDGAGPPVLCHGNVYPAHVAFERDEAGDPLAPAATIDFEYALVAPAEYDFWRTGLPVFHTRELEPRPQFAAFRDGYESVRELPLGVERRREAWWLVNAVTYLVSLAAEHEGIGPDVRDRATAMADWIDEFDGALRNR